MSRILLRNDHPVGDHLTPYIVAEMNTSHFGDLALARAMIDSAKQAGCDCVKFQSWTADTLYAKSYYKDNAIAQRFVKKLSLADEQLVALARHCAEVGIDFASTPYSRHEAEFLVEQCQVPFIKIASMELNNHPYLDHLGRLGVPLVLSTGMGSMEEIRAAVEVIARTGNERLVILHCVSVYPAEPEMIRLHNILGLRSEFPQYPIGYSDHTLGIEVPVAAVALGACLIEKHFTLDSGRIGMDNQMATEPDEMARMVSACRHVHTAMGGAARLLDEREIAQRAKMRRSLVAARPLPAGHVLTADDLDAKRPGTGIAPCDIAQVLGRPLAVDLDADEAIAPQHLA